MATEHQHFLSLENINPNIKEMSLRLPIRTSLLARVKELEKELKDGVKKPYGELINSIQGNLHSLGHTPITFIRQILSTVVYPPLLNDPNFPEDVKSRAKSILSICKGDSLGSYTEEIGIEIIRKHVAEFVERRDGVPCDWRDIILCGGTADGIPKLLELFINTKDGKKVGVMCPVPSYPLFSLIVYGLGLHEIKYSLDESRNWRINVDELQRKIDEAKEVCIPKVLVIINPGNPTSQVLTEQNIQEIIQFAYKENLYLLADEVYQPNIYSEDLEFHSFKKVLTEMGEPYTSMELASFMPCSKGYLGECGLRAAFIEILNMCPKVRAMFNKLNSAMLCPSTTGQAVMDAFVRPPKEGEPSYEQYIREKETILNSLKAQAKLLTDTLNSLEGVTCNEMQGAMHVFPQIRFPHRAIEIANRLNLSPDEFYCSEVLENAGILLVPGVAIGQAPGTYHVRITLSPIDKMKTMLERLAAFHKEFMDKYR